MKSKSLGFIGGGRITKIFLQALSNKETEFSSIVVSDTNVELLNDLQKRYPKINIIDSPSLPAQQDIVFIALHPPVIMEVLEQIRHDVAENSTIISLAPKISIEKIVSKLKTKKIVRMIPNATSYINEGYNPVTFAADFKPREKTEVFNMLQLLGTTFEVVEQKLEAYAILSAMLPTYFWFQWKELTKLGDPMGLTEDESNVAIQQTLQAAMNLYFESGLSPEQVMDLIPVKPIGEHQAQITEIYQTKLLGLFEKIKPE